MSVSPVSGPVAFAQAVVDKKQEDSIEAAQARLAKRQVEAEGSVEIKLIDSATENGRKPPLAIA